MHALRDFWNDFVDLIYPGCCEACQGVLVGNEDILCTTCLVNLPRLGKNHPLQKVLEDKFVLFSQVKTVNSFLFFTKKGKVQTLLHALKYKGREEIGQKLGMIAGTELLEINALPVVDLITTVPLHSLKKRIRGYNQCDAFAEGLSKATEIAWSGDLIRRVKFTSSQTGKSREKRRDNVRNGFRLNTKAIPCPKRVILIDDVITTGATLEACVEALTAPGTPCEEIHIITIAAARH